ncbi:branched-chain amino acid ABC transporter permease [Xylophilus sp. GOD-11R]|uniref:branched-chain amino acid ABC transporter permease n=1 Tax=Xylophilus sp. GOD-11R TaxID=3089814 RepID=UPI00298C96E2|nr:branched-chain amino acid ABC transporter permease [Xylophilus sp. GOD-11R]WPB58384.1 branched-chain amino acid ABC transporter permease [Xylophilus sp. GOD-11R]
MNATTHSLPATQVPAAGGDSPRPHPGRRLALAAVGLVALATLPFWAGDDYHLHLAALIATFWILVAGLNLVVGYTGLLSLGHVALLAIGAYAFAILAGTHGWPPFVALAAAGVIGAGCGFVLGLPSLRLPGFYFAMATLAFSMIVGEFLLAQDTLTGGGAGLPVPAFGAPFDSLRGFYWLVTGLAVAVTWLTWNVTRLMWGKAMVALRDSEVAAASTGVPAFGIKLTVYTFSGATAAIGGALFGSLQSYITPDTFHFELGMFFFICIVIGGRGAILGPLVGTIVLTALPEVVAPLAKLGQFFYGALLLAVVLLIPEGMGSLIGVLREKLHPSRNVKQVVAPDLARLAAALRQEPQA